MRAILLADESDAGSRELMKQSSLPLKKKNGH